MAKTVDYEREMRKLVDLLYLDEKDGREFYDENKEWDVETIERVADVVRGTFEFRRDGTRVRVRQYPRSRASKKAPGRRPRGSRSRATSR